MSFAFTIRNHHDSRYIFMIDENVNTIVYDLWENRIIERCEDNKYFTVVDNHFIVQKEKDTCKITTTDIRQGEDSFPRRPIFLPENCRESNIPSTFMLPDHTTYINQISRNGKYVILYCCYIGVRFSYLVNLDYYSSWIFKYLPEEVKNWWSEYICPWLYSPTGIILKDASSFRGDNMFVEHRDHGIRIHDLDKMDYKVIPPLEYSSDRYITDNSIDVSVDGKYIKINDIFPDGKYCKVIDTDFNTVMYVSRDGYTSTHIIADKLIMVSDNKLSIIDLLGMEEDYHYTSNPNTKITGIKVDESLSLLFISSVETYRDRYFDLSRIERFHLKPPSWVVTVMNLKNLVVVHRDTFVESLVYRPYISRDARFLYRYKPEEGMIRCELPQLIDWCPARTKYLPYEIKNVIELLLLCFNTDSNLNPLPIEVLYIIIAEYTYLPYN